MRKLLIIGLIFLGFGFSSISYAATYSFGVKKATTKINTFIKVKGSYVEESLNSFYLRKKGNTADNGLKIDKILVYSEFKSFYLV